MHGIGHIGLLQHLRVPTLLLNKKLNFFSAHYPPRVARVEGRGYFAHTRAPCQDGGTTQVPRRQFLLFSARGGLDAEERFGERARLPHQALLEGIATAAAHLHLLPRFLQDTS